MLVLGCRIWWSIDIVRFVGWCSDHVVIQIHIFTAELVLTVKICFNIISIQTRL